MKYFLICAFFISSLATAEIDPSQVLIIGNNRNPDSMRLAKMYSQARSIPPQNIIMLDLPEYEEISRTNYDQKIAHPIRLFLKQQKLENKIKILLTIYGMPLRIGPIVPNASQKSLAEENKKRFLFVYNEFTTILGLMEKMAGMGTPSPQTQPDQKTFDNFFTNLPELIKKVEMLNRAIISLIEKEPDKEKKQQMINEFMNFRILLEGQLGLSLLSKEAQQTVEQLKTEYLKIIAINPEKRDLGQTCQKLRIIGGIFMELKTLYEDYARLMGRDSISAVDSELSLVLWHDYVLAGRLPNVLNPRFTNHPFSLGQGPVLMVSRLDAPNAKIVERMIHDSIEAEKKPLQGKCYFDARGKPLNDELGFYDENIRNIAQQIKSRTKLQVGLDNSSEVFPMGSCPQTLLYCGWYSLRTYVPAFKFVTGSVGYHIASFEAVSLKKQSNQWVKRMLENGICATLGSVEEPFLDAFPLPTEFFGLLLTGKYTLAEIFYKTSRYNSWQMILIGDPLYRPFKNNPLFQEKDVELGPLSVILLR